MTWQWSPLFLALMVSPALGQAPQPIPLTTAPTITDGALIDTSTVLPAEAGTPSDGGGFLTGNHNFPNFINFMSNPLQSIDPRAVTAIYPIFGSEWISSAAPIPDGNAQLYGPAITVALSDRLAVGLNQGGYVDAHLSSSPGQRAAILRDELLANRFPGVDFSGDRSGWLNLGGFAQYTLIQDVENQFLLTGGLRWEAPCGSHEVFQGYGPCELAPYLTAGKEFGEYHILATVGYEFPAGAGDDNSRLFYGNIHFDRRLFGWLYPLVEFNSIYHTKDVDFGLDTRRGFFDFGGFESSGNIVTLAAGANAVIVPEHLEFGAVYTTVIASQRDFDANGLIVKLTIRY
jgi:hypothetical protein